MPDPYSARPLAPGWHVAGDRLIQATRHRRHRAPSVWRAKVWPEGVGVDVARFDAAQGKPVRPPSNVFCRTVLGDWPTEAAAVDAAVTMVAMMGGETLAERDARCGGG